MAETHTYIPNDVAVVKLPQSRHFSQCRWRNAFRPMVAIIDTFYNNSAAGCLDCGGEYGSISTMSKLVTQTILSTHEAFMTGPRFHPDGFIAARGSQHLSSTVRYTHVIGSSPVNRCRTSVWAFFNACARLHKSQAFSRDTTAVLVVLFL